MTRSIIISFVCLILFTNGINAQERHLLTINEALAKAENGNRQIRMAQINEEKTASNRRLIEGMFLPQISINYGGMITNNPLNAFGFLLQQGHVTQASFNPDLLNSPDATHQFTAGIDLKVPIVNMDLFYARKGARFMEEGARHQREYAKTQTEYNIRYAYTALQMAYRSAEILDSTLTDVNTICRNVKNFYDEGLVQKSDVMNAEVQVRTVESAIAKARNAVSDASDQLKLAMGEPLGGEDYAVVPLTQECYAANNTTLSIYMRDDLLAMRSGLSASEMAVKSARAALLPRINAFGSYQFNDKKFMGFHKGAYMAGVSISWNLFDGNVSRAKLRAATADQSLMQEAYHAKMEASEAEFHSNLRKLEQLQAEILRQEASVEQSAEALRVVKNRHAEGLDSTTELLTSRATLLRHQLEQAQTVMEYNITYYYQQMITKISTE